MFQKITTFFLGKYSKYCYQPH